MTTMVREIMTQDPACCTPTTQLAQVARMMVDGDCGAIPVVESERSRKLVGVVTDRDIVCRTVAEKKNPIEMSAESCMSNPVVTTTPDTSIDDCCQRMEEHQVRRVPVVDQDGSCCGIVAQADVARARSAKAAEVVEKVSEPSSTHRR